MTRTTRFTLLTTGALLGALTLSACGSSDPADMDGMDHGSSSDSPSAEAGADVNDADVMFAQMMIPHHQQAIEMSDLLLEDGSASPEVNDLAQQIKDVQTEEIETLTGWLEDWGADTDPGSMDHGAMGHDDGMMSEDDMAALESASGPEMQMLYLEQMIVHHEGAVAMARTEVDEGQNPDAVALAEEMVETQEDEIVTMQRYLATMAEQNG